MNSFAKKKMVLSDSANLELMFRNSQTFSSTTYLVPNENDRRSESSKRWNINKSPLLRRPSRLKVQHDLPQRLFTFTAPIYDNTIESIDQRPSTSMNQYNYKQLIQPRVGGRHYRRYSCQPRSNNCLTQKSNFLEERKLDKNPKLFIPKIWKALKGGGKTKSKRVVRNLQGVLVSSLVRNQRFSK